MKINSIQNLSFKGARQNFSKINKTRAENYNDTFDDKWIANAGINAKTGEMSINAAMPGAIDSNVFYIIKENGSGEIYNCWSPRSIQYKEGTFSSVYNKALEIADSQNGKISKEQSCELLAMAGEFANSKNEIKNL